MPGRGVADPGPRRLVSSGLPRLNDPHRRVATSSSPPRTLRADDGRWGQCAANTWNKHLSALTSFTAHCRRPGLADHRSLAAPETPQGHRGPALLRPVPRAASARPRSRKDQQGHPAQCAAQRQTPRRERGPPDLRTPQTATPRQEANLPTRPKSSSSIGGGDQQRRRHQNPTGLSECSSDEQLSSSHTSTRDGNTKGLAPRFRRSGPFDFARPQGFEPQTSDP
jgi:hypothetical protein